MIIGVPKEIIDSENRVSLTPYSVQDLVKSGHSVLIENNAGLGSGFSNHMYTDCGGSISGTSDELFSQSDMIVKVKEPQKDELLKIKPNQIIFTFLHFAASLELTNRFMDTGAIGIAYETVQLENGTLPLLLPMSEIAGRLSVHNGAKCLEHNEGGRGVLISGTTGVKPATVTILGAGIVGSNACKLAAGLGANVNILDININRLKYISDIMPANVTTVFSNQHNISELITKTDLLIGAVLVVGKKAPNLVTNSMLKTMKSGSVIIDVAVDQGGCVESCKPTTHSNPTYLVNDVLHYCVSNMPGAVPYTSTLALNNATLPYVKALADLGYKEAIRENFAIKKGLNIYKGNVTHKAVAETLDLPYKHVSDFI